ncbi:hypothetical protein HK097_009863 [Rhizophlyctis rosea]|uniref:Uncharacterized protein n=1 Tax=Rhizophlyctis rosea TaxID=64517 RepID=A0AAD5S8B7_9FUNG|nr:hypothetical protein HK097_009863 [Rhizophlyctis rosea]
MKFPPHVQSCRAEALTALAALKKIPKDKNADGTLDAIFVIMALAGACTSYWPGEVFAEFQDVNPKSKSNDGGNVAVGQGALCERGERKGGRHGRRRKRVSFDAYQDALNHKLYLLPPTENKKPQAVPKNPNLNNIHNIRFALLSPAAPETPADGDVGGPSAKKARTESDCVEGVEEAAQEC